MKNAETRLALAMRKMRENGRNFNSEKLIARFRFVWARKQLAKERNQQ